MQAGGETAQLESPGRSGVSAMEAYGKEWQGTGTACRGPAHGRAASPSGLKAGIPCKKSMETYRTREGWWLAPDRPRGMRPDEAARRPAWQPRGPFPGRPRPIARWWSPGPGDGRGDDEPDEGYTAWGLGTRALGTSIDISTPPDALPDTPGDMAETWAGPGEDTPPPGCAPAVDPDGEPRGAGDRFCWRDGRGWLAPARAQAGDLAAAPAGEEGDRVARIRAGRAARDLVRETPHLATPEALIAAGFLAPEQADPAARWLGDAWADALDTGRG